MSVTQLRGAAATRLRAASGRFPIAVPPVVGLLVTAALVTFVVAFLIPELPSSRLTVRVDVLASKGSAVVLFLDDQTDPPQVARLTPGLRGIYEFDAGDGNIERIRVDVGEQPGADIRLFSIDVLEDDGKVAAHFGPAELIGWARYGAGPATSDAEALHITSQDTRATVDAFVSVPSPSRLPWPLQPVVDEIEDGLGRLRIGFALIAVGAAAVALGRRRGRWAVALGIAAGAAAIGSTELVMRNPSGIAEASEAVGRSTYFGLSLPTSVRAVRAGFLVGGVLAVAAALLWRWRSRGAPDTVPAGRDAPPRPGILGLLAALAVFAAAVATLTPDLRAIVRESATTQLSTGWDVENLLAWNGFAASGLVPMDDFWYPYGNWAVFSSSLLTGPVVFAAYQILLFLCFWWVFWVASGRRLVASSAASLGLLLAQPIIGEFPRYGLPLAVALSYSCIDPDADRRQSLPARLVFGAATIGTLFLDPILVAYAAVGVAPLLLLDAIRARDRGLTWWGRRLGADLALPAAGFVAWLVVTALRGQLDAMFDLYSALGVSAIYSAEPTPFWTGLGESFELTELVVWVPVVLVAVGVFGRLSQPGDGLAHGLPSRLLILGAVAFPILHKHVVRGTPTQLLLFLVVAAILVLLWANAERPSSKLVGALAGLGAAVLLAFPGPEVTRDRLEAWPSRIVDSFDLVLTDRAEIRGANAARFAPARLSGYGPELAVAADLGPRLDEDDHRDLFVLGDAPMLYVLLRQRPAWHITAYDASPLEEQRRQLAWLRENDPRFLAIDRTSQVFDGIPHAVRIPLVYQYAIRGYVFDHSVGSFDILRRRRTTEPVDRRYWAAALTTDLDLGRVPDVSSYDELEPCSDGRSDNCGRFLRLHPPTERASGLVETQVRFGAQTVNVRFTAGGARNLYTVPLARTWPWVLSGEPVLVGPPSDGWRAEIVTGVQSHDTLY